MGAIGKASVRAVAASRTLNVPNWDSTGDGVTIQWSDFEQPSLTPAR